MRQQLVSIGEGFDIADEHGNPVYRVDGKALRLRETFVIEDLQGREVATIREKKLALRESMDVLRGGAKIATIRKARFAPFRDKFSIDVEGAQDMVAQGDILHHEYDIRRGDEAVARVSKHRFAMRAIPTGSRSPRARTKGSCWRWRSHSTRWPTTQTERTNQRTFGRASHGAHLYARRYVSRALL
jgi:uncharacterized protein YxjI